MHPRKALLGGALLTALFIMTLVAIVATAMSTRLQLDIYRTRLMIIHDKMYLASQGVTFWSLSELKNNKNKFTQANAQGMVKEFPKNYQSIYQQVTLSGGLYDLQARFNLNNLLEKQYVLPFTNLLGILVPNLNTLDKKNFVLAIKNWLGPYDLAQGNDVFASFYQSQKPAYNSSHQLMKSLSELRLVKDVSASFYLALEPYVTVLPETTPVNINTASPKVLMSLGNGLNSAQISELMMARGETGIIQLKEINELLRKIDLPMKQITVESTYFLSISVAQSDEFKLKIYTLLKRDKDKKGKVSVRIIRQSMNYM